MPTYLEQDATTDPEMFSSAILRLSGETQKIVDAVRGLLIHNAFLEFYALSEVDFAHASRTTLDTSDRLAQLLGTTTRDTITHLPAADRQICTCRDYALLTCSFHRVHRIPSRIRCGFATYFPYNPYEDHWICEIWDSAHQCWRRIDAQLDEAHQDRLNIAFNTLDVPADAFLAASEVWQLLDADAVNVEEVGHGATTGEWFLYINIMREHLALSGVIRSDWDSWREARPEARVLDNEQRECMAVIAQETLKHQAASTAFEAQKLPEPPWIGPS